MSDKPKKLRVTMSDGIYEIPLSVIHHHRSKYFAQRDADRGDGTFEANFKREMEYIATDQIEALVWAANNMNWSTLEPHSVKVENADEVDHDDEWPNAEKEIT